MPIFSLLVFNVTLLLNQALIYVFLGLHIGEGNGTPLQYSCLENPMEGRAWQAAVHGVAQSRTPLSDFTFTFHFHAWRRKWQPTPVFLPGESQGQGSLVGCHLWGCTESDTAEATQQQQQDFIFFFSFVHSPNIKEKQNYYMTGQFLFGIWH